MRDRVERVVREYGAQGWHRTGSRVDGESAEWLVGRVEELGFSARLESFELDRVVPGESYLEIAGQRVDGFPLFDGSFTDSAGVEGVLGEGGSDCDVALVNFPPSGFVDEIWEWRNSSRYKALVGVVKTESGDLAIRNAENFISRGGLPVLQVADGEYSQLVDAARRGDSVKVVAQAEVVRSEVFIVVVEVAGRDQSLPPLVVMTPRSGWFSCAIERGGGIACWLEILREFSESQPERDVVFIATSGHELGHLGLEAFLERNEALVERVGLWLHLGASIGAALDWNPALQTSDAELERVALESFDRAGIEGDLAPFVVPTGTVGGGEALQIHRMGGRFVSIIGGHSLFHQEGDVWPDAVDVGALVGYATALVGVAVVLGGD
jgi:hypothetical protein